MSDSERTRIALYAIEHGATAAARKLSREFGRRVAESTARDIKNKYVSATAGAKAAGGIDVLRRFMSKTGRPSAMGPECDALLIDRVDTLRRSGATINRAALISAAREIISGKDPSLLWENGGRVRLERGWATAMMRRLGLVRPKKAARIADPVPAVSAQVSTERPAVSDGSDSHEQDRGMPACDGWMEPLALGLLSNSTTSTGSGTGSGTGTAKYK